MISTIRGSASRARRRALLLLILAAVAAVGVVACWSASPAPRSHASVDPRADREETVADGAVTAEDGLLPGATSAFDETQPGVGRLSRELLDALQHAARDAAGDGVAIQVNSGWRSAEYQDSLLQDAVADYGSAEEAARWVASAATSAHVAGEAVDVGSYDAVDWLAERGASYGLCQTYANESWHFELRPEAAQHGCPRPYSDPTEDPRLQ